VFFPFLHRRRLSVYFSVGQHSARIPDGGVGTPVVVTDSPVRPSVIDPTVLSQIDERWTD